MSKKYQAASHKITDLTDGSDGSDKMNFTPEVCRELYDFVHAFTTLSGQLLLMSADNGIEIYEKAVSICKKARGEK